MRGGGADWFVTKWPQTNKQKHFCKDGTAKSVSKVRKNSGHVMLSTQVHKEH